MVRIKAQILLLLILTVTILSAQFSFDVSVNKNDITINERIQLTLSISGPSQNLGNINLSSIPGFDVVGGPSQSSSYSFINGRVSASMKNTYVLLPNKTGKLQIPAMSININGKSYSSKPITINVRPAGQQTKTKSKPQKKGKENQPTESTIQPKGNIFMVMMLNNYKPYIEEQVILSIRIYRRIQLWGNTGFNFPEKLTGFWREDLSGNFKERRVNLNGIQYILHELKIALFPTIAGKKTIPPADFSYSMSPFHGSSKVTSNSIELEVLPLPEPKPKNFKGYIGTFNVNASVDRRKLKTNEALKYMFKVEGYGNIKTIDEPNIDFPPELNLFDSSKEVDLKKSDDGIHGTKIFEYILIPRVKGKFKIPSAVFKYFDVKKRRYRTLKTKPITINVAQGKKTEQNQVVYIDKEGIRVLRKEIRYLYSNPVKKSWIIFYRNKKILIFIVTFFFLYILSLIYYKHKSKLLADKNYENYLVAYKNFKQMYKNARKYMRKKNVSKVYETIHKAIIQFVNQRFGLNISENMKDSLERFGRDRNLNNEKVNELIEITEYCDMIRFAPSQVEEIGMKDLLKKIKKIIKYFNKNVRRKF